MAKDDDPDEPTGLHVVVGDPDDLDTEQAILATMHEILVVLRLMEAHTRRCREWVENEAPSREAGLG